MDISGDFFRVLVCCKVGKSCVLVLRMDLRGCIGKICKVVDTYYAILITAVVKGSLGLSEWFWLRYS